jgi:hypothetical protein
VEKETGAVLVTRGRFYASRPASVATLSDGDRPLYLYVTAKTKDALAAGVRKVAELIEAADGRSGVAHVLSLRPSLAALLPFVYVESVRDASTPPFRPGNNPNPATGTSGSSTAGASDPDSGSFGPSGARPNGPVRPHA